MKFVDNKFKKIKLSLITLLFLFICNSTFAKNYKLDAKNVEYIGNRLRYDKETKKIRWWFFASDYLLWRINVEKSGYYKVRLKYSLEDEHGGICKLISDRRTLLEFKPKVTKGWSNYKNVILGRVFIKAGKQIVMLKALRVNKTLMDFVEMEFIEDSNSSK